MVVPNFAGPPALPFQIADPGNFRQRMEEAGLEDIRILQETESVKINSGGELWNMVMNSNPVARQVTANLTKEQEIQVQQSLEDMVKEQAGGNDVAVLTAELNVGVGRKNGRR